MPNAEEIKQRIEAAIPGAQAEVEDWTGGGDHFKATVTAQAFAGRSRIEQHKLVYEVFGAEIGGPIHALSLKTQSPQQPGAATMSDTDQNQIRDAIGQAISEHEVILFMKGTPEAPACGFSARTVAALQALEAPFAAVDVLPDPRIRQELSAISQWPTIPQLFVKGELVGGCDIVLEMYESGDLARTLGVETDGEEQQARELLGGEAETLAPGLTQIENRLG
jgi:monothiol glutaredoxin